jgi:hypothetical protein
MQIDGIVVSALMGLGAAIIGMIIIWLTPEERPKR